LAYPNQGSNKEHGRDGKKANSTRRTTNNGGGKMKKVLVSIPDDIYKLMQEVKGTFGESDSEIIRTIVISFLSEKGYLSKREKT